MSVAKFLFSDIPLLHICVNFLDARQIVDRLSQRSRAHLHALAFRVYINRPQFDLSSAPHRGKSGKTGDGSFQLSHIT